MANVGKYNVTDRVMFDGKDLSPLVSCKVSKPIMPPVEATFSTVPGRDGDIYRSSRLSGYDLTVDMYLRSSHRRDVAELRHVLAAMLRTDGPAPLYLPDDPSRYLMAVVKGETNLGRITDGTPHAEVTFHVCDPYYYGASRAIEFASCRNFNVKAGGTHESRPVFRLKPRGSYVLKVENYTTGEKVKMLSTVESGDSVVIDCERELCTVNGNVSAVSVDSDYFAIDGVMEIVAINADGEMRWSERWL